MIETNNQPQGPDRLDQAVNAFRAMPVPAGPSPQLQAQIASMMQSAAGAGRRFKLYKRIKAMKPKNKLLAAASILVSLSATIVGLAVLLGKPGVAFADIKEQFCNAKTVQLSAEVTVGQGASAYKTRIKLYVKEGVGMRNEMEPMGVMVYNYQQRKGMILNTKLKEATFMDLPATPAGESHGSQDMLEAMRKAFGFSKNEKSIGEKEINGRRAKGYCTTDNANTFEVWADAKTGELLMINVDMKISGMPPMKMVYQDILLNKDMPDSLFSVQPPQGYTVKQMKNMDLGQPTEKDLAEGLKIMATYNGGVFPQLLAIQAGSAEAKRIAEGEKLAKLGEAQKQAVVQKLVKMTMFSSANVSSDFHYAGGGIKLGDGKRPIAWWKQKNSELYRVLYGDLTFKDRKASQLPATGPARTASCPAR